MTTLIVYATKHGCTEKVAGILAEGIEGKIDLLNLKSKKEVDFSYYNKIIIGGSIHNGKINGLVSDFVIEHEEMLKTKKCGFFICYMDSDEKAREYMVDSFPMDLLNNAFAIGYFGGEFNLEKMDIVDRMMIQKVAGIKESVSKIKYESIAQFINLANCHKKKAPENKFDFKNQLLSKENISSV